MHTVTGTFSSASMSKIQNEAVQNTKLLNAIVKDDSNALCFARFHTVFRSNDATSQEFTTFTSI